MASPHGQQGRMALLATPFVWFLLVCVLSSPTSAGPCLALTEAEQQAKFEREAAAPDPLARPTFTCPDSFLLGLPAAALHEGGRSLSPALAGITSRDDLPRLLRWLNLRGEGAELGVWQGAFARHLLESSHLSVYHLIDYWGGSDGEKNLKMTQGALHRHQARYRVHKMLTTEAVKQFRDGQLDYLYIDATHTYNDVRRELPAYYPKVKVGGIIAGHDWNSWPVADAVQEFADVHGIRLYHTLSDRLPSWYFIKCTDYEAVDGWGEPHRVPPGLDTRCPAPIDVAQVQQYRNRSKTVRLLPPEQHSSVEPHRPHYHFPTHGGTAGVRMFNVPMVHLKRLFDKSWQLKVGHNPIGTIVPVGEHKHLTLESQVNVLARQLIQDNNRNNFKGEIHLQAVSMGSDKHSANLKFKRKIVPEDYAPQSLSFVHLAGVNATFGELRYLLVKWYPKLVLNGLLVGNGYQLPHVRDAVHAFAKVYHIRVHCTREDPAPSYYLYRLGTALD